MEIGTHGYRFHRPTGVGDEKIDRLDICPGRLDAGQVGEPCVVVRAEGSIILCQINRGR